MMTSEFFVYNCSPVFRTPGEPGILHGEGCSYVQPLTNCICMSERDKIKGAGRYAYLLYDATFKLVICTPENEKLLIEILELLIPGKHIASITFINREQHARFGH